MTLRNWAELSGNHIEQRRLARAVRADQPYDFVFPAVDGHIVHGDQAANCITRLRVSRNSMYCSFAHLLSLCRFDREIYEAANPFDQLFFKPLGI